MLMNRIINIFSDTRTVSGGRLEADSRGAVQAWIQTGISTSRLEVVMLRSFHVKIKTMS